MNIEANKDMQDESNEESKEESEVEIEKISFEKVLDKDNKNKEIVNKQKENKNKTLFSFPKTEHIFKYLNSFRDKLLVYKFCNHLIQILS